MTPAYWFKFGAAVGAVTGVVLIVFGFRRVSGTVAVGTPTVKQG